MQIQCDSWEQGRSVAMFQVLVQYFDQHYASFFTKGPVEEYALLLPKIKELIPYFGQLEDNQIRVAYKDVQSDCYINID